MKNFYSLEFHIVAYLVFIFIFILWLAEETYSNKGNREVWEKDTRAD